MNLLTIAGTDPTSGAGIQRDLQTFSSFGHQGFSVITAVTAQSTLRFKEAEPITAKTVASQIDTLLEDIKIDGIKIGMLYTSSIIKEVAKRLNLKVPIVVDPVIKATTGGALIKKEAKEELIKRIIPKALVVTPNIKEAAIIAGMKIESRKDMVVAAEKIYKKGAKNVVITGLEEKDRVVDYVYSDKNVFLSSKKLKGISHGGGCSFSAAILSAITNGKGIIESIKCARKFTNNALKNSKKIGQGIPITQVKETKLKSDLQDAILEFVSKKNAYKLIPQCQTNFVYAKPTAKTIREILAIDGRIVRTQKGAIVAGTLAMGGSRHVARAVLEVTKQFPEIRSAINIRYSSDILDKMKKKRMTILSYDRDLEPKAVREKEGVSIPWGIREAIKDTAKVPDAIYHKGAIGKEPMIIIFGHNPKDVVNKIKGLA